MSQTLQGLAEEIRLCSFVQAQPDGTQVRLLSLQSTREVADHQGVSLRQVELAAVQARILPARYQRSLGTVGWKGQVDLLSARVAVVGAGGLGGWIVEGLARMGVGELVVIDGDRVEENNLNRQLVALESSLGRPKAELAEQRVHEVNAATDVVAHVVWADESNLSHLLAGTTVVADALDTLPARLMLQRAAAEMGIPMVHGAIAGCTGQVMTILPEDPGLYALYGAESVPERGLETRLGNPAPTPMLIASWQVQEIVKLIIGKGQLLRNRLLLLDTEANAVDILDLGGDGR